MILKFTQNDGPVLQYLDMFKLKAWKQKESILLGL